MKIIINSAGQVSADHRALDIGISIKRGYEIYALSDAPNAIKVSDRLQHLIGRRIVLDPKKETQMTEASFIAEIERALA